MSDSTPIENELKIGGEPMIRVGTIENIQDSPEKVAKLLASMGKKSLDFIDDKEHSLLKESYRIEIVPIEYPRWEFQLHIHPKYWFDMLYYKEAKNDEDKKAIIKIAREYVNGVRSSYRPSFPKTAISLSFEKLLQVPSNLRFKKKKWFKYHINYIAPDVYCNKGKRSTNCNWYAEDERHVKTMKMKNGDQYIILSRQKHVRNLLISPINHRTNRDLVKDASFWEWILGDVINKFLLTICKKPYPVKCFAINFGKWESESSKDENVVECHAHFHLHITEEVVDKMERKQDKNGYAIYPAMHGKVNDPIKYGLKNCKELETSRLSSLEIARINQELVDLNKKLDEMDKKLDKKFDEMDKKFNEKFDEMNKKLCTFMESFSSLKTEKGSLVNN